jgi:hypothetical protein
LDFVAPRPHASPLGVALLIVGVAALAGALVEYRSLEARRAGLALKLSAATAQQRGRAAADAALAATHLADEAGAAARELATPWTGLLADLEAASGDTHGEVAVLSVEPDEEAHRVRIGAESRDLAHALAYVQRLQMSHALRFPMLDSHELRTDDAEHPIRFVMSADWVTDR